MNKQITRLAVAAIVLIASLIIATTYWQTWATAGLADRQDNALMSVARFTIDRGKIYAGDGRFLLATNVKRRVGGQTLYFRHYPSGDLAPHVIGYSTIGRSTAGLERSENDYLTGANGSLSSIANKTIDQLKGVTVKGNDLLLSINVRAQRLAVQQLQGKCGAAVAIEPSTGRVLVLASSPTYNPNAVEKSFSAITRIKTAACSFAAPLLDRATQGLYPPGSTFKTVTAAAALDDGIFTPSSTFYDPGYCTEYGKPVSNALDQQGGSHRRVDPTRHRNNDAVVGRVAREIEILKVHRCASRPICQKSASSRAAVAKLAARERKRPSPPRRANCSSSAAAASRASPW